MGDDIRIAVSGLELSYQARKIDASRRWYLDLFRTRTTLKRVLSGVDFIACGAGVTAILGRNGAGKTTLMKAMTGILTPTSGSLAVLGFEPRRRKAAMLRCIGVVFGQKKSLWEDLSLEENLRVTASVYGLDRKTARLRAAELVETLALGDLLDRPVKTFSLGESMKAEIANVLLFEPRVLFLDEPTIGLDLPAQHAIRKVIKSYVVTHGGHIILTSHNMRDIAELADTIYFLEGGRLSRFQTPDADSSLEASLERRLMS